VLKLLLLLLVKLTSLQVHLHLIKHSLVVRHVIAVEFVTLRLLMIKIMMIEVVLMM
jgi:hypothetical protein